MPRDLFAQNEDAGMTESPGAQTPKAGAPMESRGYSDFTVHGIYTDKSPHPVSRSGKNAVRRNDLHPYVQTLSIADLDSCEMLERACFPEEERCTREKVYTSTFVQYTVLEATDLVAVAYASAYALAFGGGWVYVSRCLALWSCSLRLLPSFSTLLCCYQKTLYKASYQT